MPILNYTTTVAADKSVGQILTMLAKGGARSTMANYGANGKVESIAFAVLTPMGMRTFSLPIDPAKVLAVMRRERVAPRFLNAQHAEDVAWRIMKDWLEAQLAIIATEMVTLDQVMLPYMQANDAGQTVYEMIVDAQLALPAGEGPIQAVSP